MKRGPENNSDYNTQPAKKAHTINKSLKELLQEVNNGQYEDFRAYLLQNKITELNFYQKARQINLSNLGCALKGTSVNSLYLANNDIGASDAAKLAKPLKYTAVTTLSLAGNNIGSEGAEKLGKALKNTPVTHLNIFGNHIGAHGAEKLVNNLKDTNVTDLNLGCNNIGAEGAEKLSNALKDSTITVLDLWHNNIGNAGAAALTACIPNTLLMKVKLEIVYENLKQALAINERKLIQTPYTAICLTHLPENQKAKYYNLAALSNIPSKEVEIRFAGGILASLGSHKSDLQALIISYLPLMDYKRAEKLQALAQQQHGKKGLQIEDNKENEQGTYCSIQ